MNGSPKPLLRRRSPVSRRYRRFGGRLTRDEAKDSPNVIRLKALVRLFRLSPAEIARASGFSRCYVARLLSPNDDFTGSPDFFRNLESKLGEVISGRSSQFFTVPAVSVRRARDVLGVSLS